MRCRCAVQAQGTFLVGSKVAVVHLALAWVQGMFEAEERRLAHVGDVAGVSPVEGRSLPKVGFVGRDLGTEGGAAEGRPGGTRRGGVGVTPGGIAV